ncbi:MAG: lysophospholipid transporter LplT [Pseudomonadota bacterium]
MNKAIYPLLAAQFISAFADNAILFTIIAMVMQTEQLADWYVPALQSVFLVAFVLLAPWAGPFADNRSKPRVLIFANIIKGAGAVLLLAGLEPLAAYAIVGAGAAVYSPAKYGILPEIAGHGQLVKANSWIEGSTILAIILGMVVGAKIADSSIPLALQGVIVLFAASAAITLLLPALPARGAKAGPRVALFAREMKGFLETSRARFAILGASLFWAAAATLRVILVAWAPLVLMSRSASDIADLTLFLAIGIVAGSVLVPRIIPLEHLRRARLAAYAMSVFIVLLAFMDVVWPTRVVLFVIGMAGGMFVVPINAALQEIGHQSIGSGGAVAIQGFCQNVPMLLAVGFYTLAAALGAGPVAALLVLGLLVFAATFLVARSLANSENSSV